MRVVSHTATNGAPPVSHTQQVSVNDIILKAVAVALKDMPAANTYWNVQLERTEAFPTVDVCVAVSTDKGLITPVVRNADKKSLQEVRAGEGARVGPGLGWGRCGTACLEGLVMPACLEGLVMPAWRV